MAEELETDWENHLSRFRVRVSVGWAGSVAGIKKALKFEKKKKSVTEIWKISPETGKTCWNLENLAGNWKFSPESGKTCQNLHFLLKIAWIFPDLAKSYQI